MIFFDIDTQRDFMDGDGALYVPEAESVLPNIELLLRAASEKEIITISSRCAHNPNDPEFDIFPPHCIEGTNGAERIFPHLPNLPRHEIAVDALHEPQPKLVAATHYIVKKKVFDLFSNAWLEALLFHGIFRNEECVVFGVATDYCVRACGSRLANAGARVWVVEDAIRGVAAETTRQTIDEMRIMGVEFTTTDEVLKRIRDSRFEIRDSRLT